MTTGGEVFGSNRMVKTPERDNGTQRVQAPQKLSEVLFHQRVPSFATIAAVPSNVEAIEAGLMFSACIAPLVAIVGPTGWGKTHLLNACARRLSQQFGECIAVVSGEDYLSGQLRFEGSQPLILDDCQEVVSKVRPRAMFRLALERRVRACRPTLLAFTGGKPGRALRSLLPNYRSWTVVGISTPQAEERILLVNHLASEHGLSLAPGLVQVLAQQLNGNGRTMAGALTRLRMCGPAWLDAGAVLQACGLMEPFFGDNSSWDLKHRIIRTAESHRTAFAGVAPIDLALYVMLHVASLSEVEVARAIDAEPAAAYLRAARFAKAMEREPGIAGCVERFIELVVASLAHD